MSRLSLRGFGGSAVSPRVAHPVLPRQPSGRRVPKTLRHQNRFG
jgi:hypothetical protein